MNWVSGFQKGDIIEFCDEMFEVIQNDGSSGTVREYFGENSYGDTISNFKWEFQGIRCQLKSTEQPSAAEAE